MIAFSMRRSASIIRVFSCGVLMLGCGGSTRTANTANTTTSGSENTNTTSGEDPTHGIVVEGGLGTIPIGQVRATLSATQEELNRCFSSRLEDTPYLSGDLTMKIRIAGDGSVKWVVFPRNTLGNATVEQCLLGKMNTVKFTAPTGGEAEVTFPMVFDAGTEYRPAVAWPDDRLEATVRQHHSAIDRCVHGARGPFDVTVYAAPHGQVASVGVAESHDDALHAASCVATEVASWTLPDPGSYWAKGHFRIP